MMKNFCLLLSLCACGDGKYNDEEREGYDGHHSSDDQTSTSSDKWDVGLYGESSSSSMTISWNPTDNVNVRKIILSHSSIYGREDIEMALTDHQLTLTQLPSNTLFDIAVKACLDDECYASLSTENQTLQVETDMEIWRFTDVNNPIFTTEDPDINVRLMADGSIRFYRIMDDVHWWSWHPQNNFDAAIPNLNESCWLWSCNSESLINWQVDEQVSLLQTDAYHIDSWHLEHDISLCVDSCDLQSWFQSDVAIRAFQYVPTFEIDIESDDDWNLEELQGWLFYTDVNNSLFQSKNVPNSTDGIVTSETVFENVQGFHLLQKEAPLFWQIYLKMDDQWMTAYALHPDETQGQDHLEWYGTEDLHSLHLQDASGNSLIENHPSYAILGGTETSLGKHLFVGIPNSADGFDIIVGILENP